MPPWSSGTELGSWFNMTFQNKSSQIRFQDLLNDLVQVVILLRYFFALRNRAYSFRQTDLMLPLVFEGFTFDGVKSAAIGHKSFWAADVEFEASPSTVSVVSCGGGGAWGPGWEPESEALDIAFEESLSKELLDLSLAAWEVSDMSSEVGRDVRLSCVARCDTSGFGDES